MRVDLSPEGIQSLIDRLDVDTRLEVSRTAEKAAMDVAAIVADEMRNAAHVDTGALLASIRAVEDPLQPGHWQVIADPSVPRRSGDFHYAQLESNRPPDGTYGEHDFTKVALERARERIESEYPGSVHIERIL